jgi:hypothetical protein
MFVVPQNAADKMMGQIMDLQPRGLIPDSKCPACGRKGAILVLRRDHELSQEQICLQCGQELKA